MNRAQHIEELSKIEHTPQLTQSEQNSKTKHESTP
jgi:hypothetical protein